LFVATAMLVCGVSVALAGPREQAERIHDRLAGVPPSDAVLTSMTTAIQGDPNSGPIAAANIAMANPNFYASPSRISPRRGRTATSRCSFPSTTNIALVMGMVRDDVPFNQILTGDLLYVAPGVSPPASATSNDHFAALEQRMRQPAFNQSELQQTTQSGIYGTPSAATAGAITTRAASEAFFIAGTNRAMFRFTLINHLCEDMEQVHDTSIIRTGFARMCPAARAAIAACS